MLTIKATELEQRIKHYLEHKGYNKLSEDQQYTKWALKGKRYVYTNNMYEKDVIYIGVREDGDTRNVYAGVVNNITEFKTILNNVR